MTILEKLSFSHKTRAGEHGSPEARLRRKMLDALEMQQKAAEAKQNGETFVRLETRWVTDEETGERRGKEAPVRFKPWWWNDIGGQVMLDLRYGNRRVELKPGMSSIEVGEADNLVPTIKLLIEACQNGEMDEVLANIKKGHHRILRKKTNS